MSLSLAVPGKVAPGRHRHHSTIESNPQRHIEGPMSTRLPRYKLTSARAKVVGRLGGIARAKALSKHQRQAIARKASLARWGTLYRL
jgi:hypothetical protein